ncbi:hypothetical protein KW794_01945, partial [Candidatus Saccharibacteria bacterium]|nr:hypothetical protein [Candidatus Saccharibacteria bacterium]
MSLFSKNKNQNRKPINHGRSRTPMTAYYRGRPVSDETSPFTKRAPKRKLRRYVYGFMDVILLSLLILFIGYSLIVRPQPNIKADNYIFHSLADYRSATASQLSHFNNRNKITFDEQGLKTVLKSQFAEINDVQVELPLLSEQPVINLSISHPAFFLDSQGDRYVIDSSGRAVAKAASLPKVKNLPLINDSSGFRIALSRQVLGGDGVSFINNLITQCRLANIPLATLSLPAVPLELDLKTKDQPYFVKFYLGGDELTQIGQFLATRHHFSQTNQQPSQYLDVRVAGKVFYLFL